MIFHANIKSLMLAGVLLVASAHQAFSDNVLRWYVAADSTSAQLTYLGLDSANMQCYEGTLDVPAEVVVSGRVLPVSGVTARAAASCVGLERVVLPSSVSSLGFGAFADCPCLAEVLLPEQLTELADACFYCDSALLRAELPGTLPRVGAGAFAFCQQLDSLVLSYGLRRIAPRAFYGCRSLQRVTLPSSLTQLGEQAFAYCTGLAEVWAPGSPLAITADVFEGVDCASCRLVVPPALVKAYREAEVWCDFDIVEGDFSSLEAVPVDASADNGLTLTVEEGRLVLCVSGDAPALVYDLRGRRLAVASSHSGRNVFTLPMPQTYIVRCGRMTHRVLLQ